MFRRASVKWAFAPQKMGRLIETIRRSEKLVGFASIWPTIARHRRHYRQISQYATKIFINLDVHPATCHFHLSMLEKFADPIQRRPIQNILFSDFFFS